MVAAKKKHPKTFLEKVEDEIVHEAEGYLNYKTEVVKKKILSISEVSVLVILGFFLISFGLAALLAKYVSILDGGFSYVLLGVLFIVISFMIKV